MEVRREGEVGGGTPRGEVEKEEEEEGGGRRGGEEKSPGGEWEKTGERELGGEWEEQRGGGEGKMWFCWWWFPGERGGEWEEERKALESFRGLVPIQAVGPSPRVARRGEIGEEGRLNLAGGDRAEDLLFFSLERRGAKEGSQGEVLLAAVNFRA